MKLWLVRHADASPGSPRDRDFDRRLSPRGQQDAARFARWLVAHPDRPDRVVSSSAARAQATASLAISHFDARAVSLELEPRLYDADVETILDVVRESSASFRSLAIVAHNPAISHAASLLATDARAISLPPLGVALLDVGKDWCDVRLHCAARLLTTHPGDEMW